MRCFRLERILETFAGVKLNPLSFGDGDQLPRPRIPSLPRFTLLDFETPKSRESNSFPPFQRFFYPPHHRFEGLISLKIGDPRILGHHDQDFLFCHYEPPVLFLMLGRWSEDVKENKR